MVQKRDFQLPDWTENCHEMWRGQLHLLECTPLKMPVHQLSSKVRRRRMIAINRGRTVKMWRKIWLVFVLAPAPGRWIWRFICSVSPAQDLVFSQNMFCNSFAGRPLQIALKGLTRALGESACAGMFYCLYYQENKVSVSVVQATFIFYQVVEMSPPIAGLVQIS